MESRVKEILSWYSSDSPGTRTNIARLLNHGRLAGTGKLVILPVDQGFEHGPARSFAVNPAAYDPAYHFRLAIDGLDCSKVAGVEPLVVRTVVAATQAGEERFRQIVPRGVEIGDLVVRFAESGARDIYAWHEDFVVNGNCGADREKSGTLELLSPAAEVVLTLTFGGLGIYKLTRAAAATDAVPMVTASMYCETLAVAPT